LLRRKNTGFEQVTLRSTTENEEQMANNFLGYLVSIECNNVFYQGTVSKIDLVQNTIKLTDYYRNGLKSKEQTTVEIK
jgi:hypothetical protein